MARENPFDAIILDVMLPGANGYQVCRTLRNGIGVHSSDRCHCVTSWPKGVAELNGSSAAAYRRNRAINAQYKCGKTTLLMISVRSFVTGDRALAHPDRKSYPVVTNSARDPRQCAGEAVGITRGPRSRR